MSDNILQYWMMLGMIPVGFECGMLDTVFVSILVCWIQSLYIIILYSWKFIQFSLFVSNWASYSSIYPLLISCLLTMILFDISEYWKALVVDFGKVSSQPVNFLWSFQIYRAMSFVFQGTRADIENGFSGFIPERRALVRTFCTPAFA